jgi:hypothetical protein
MRDMSEFETRWGLVVGRAALLLWPELPRDIQERLFEAAAASDEQVRYNLAVFLHDRHPRTAHPPKPTAIA